MDKNLKLNEYKLSSPDASIASLKRNGISGYLKGLGTSSFAKFSFVGFANRYFYALVLGILFGFIYDSFILNSGEVNINAVGGIASLFIVLLLVMLSTALKPLLK